MIGGDGAAGSRPPGRHPTIRAATVDDQEFITEMQYAALFVPTGADPPPRAILDSPDVRRYHADFGRLPGDAGVIATLPSGRAIGAAWVRRIEGYGFVDHDTPELAIAVVAAERGRGVGTAMLAVLLERVGRCSLGVDDRNPARRLYERVGFRPVRVESEHHVVMVRDADRP